MTNITDWFPETLHYIFRHPSHHICLLLTFQARVSGNIAHEHSAVQWLIQVLDVRPSLKVMNAS